MDEDPLKAYADASGINSRVYEALLRGDFESLIWGMLSEMNPDSPIATLARFMLPENYALFSGAAGQNEDSGQLAAVRALLSGTTGQNDDNGQLAAVRATLRRVAGMLGACSTCCGEEASCPECRGCGKPGSAPSTASAEELGAWLGPALDRIGMHITNQVISDDSPQLEGPNRGPQRSGVPEGTNGHRGDSAGND
jgi:hypothetical protein